MLSSTLQHRICNLTIDKQGEDLPGQKLKYRDVSLTISSSIQMYPAFVIVCTIPTAHVRTGRR